MTLVNTIVAGDTSRTGAGGCHVNAQIIRSLGNNLDSDGTCFVTAAGPCSPALDAGSGASCPEATTSRGARRPAGARCDIGAFERAHTRR